MEITPVEKANELIQKFLPYSRDWDIEGYAIFNARMNALICVNEIISMIVNSAHHTEAEYHYYKEVKKEIKKVKI